MKCNVKKKLALLTGVAIVGMSAISAKAYVSDGPFSFNLTAHGTQLDYTSEGVTKTVSGDGHAYISSATNLSKSNPIYLRVRDSNKNYATESAYVTSKQTVTMPAKSGYTTGKSYLLFGQTSSASTKAVKVSGSWRP